MHPKGSKTTMPYRGHSKRQIGANIKFVGQSDQMDEKLQDILEDEDIDQKDLMIPSQPSMPK